MNHILKKAFVMTLCVGIMYGCGQKSPRKEATADQSASEAVSMAEMADEERSFEEKEANLSSKKEALTQQAPQQEKQEEKTAAPTSSAAAVENPNLRGKVFLRTSLLNFKVKEVVKTTYQLEEITVSMGGFVEKSEISSDNTGYEETKQVKADSVLVISKYKLRASLELRVPSQNMDSTLKAIAPLVDKMEYRIVQADDVSLSLLENRLNRATMQKSEQRMSNAIDNKGRRLDDIAEAEGVRQDAEISANRALLSSLKLKDRIAYSTIKLNIYQDEVTRKEMRASEKYIEEYRAPFFSEVGEGLGNGWSVVQQLFIMLANVWYLIVLGIAIYFIYRRVKKKE